MPPAPSLPPVNWVSIDFAARRVTIIVALPLALYSRLPRLELGASERTHTVGKSCGAPPACPFPSASACARINFNL